MTDPRAVLADAMVAIHPHMTQTEEFAADLIQPLAERGVLLVTEERLRAALQQQYAVAIYEDRDQLAAAIFAALSELEE